MNKKNNIYWYFTFSFAIILIATVVAFEYGEALGKVIAEHNDTF